MSRETKLNARQLKFAESYEGNATEAARLAGYRGDDASLGVIGHRLLKNVKITELIANRSKKQSDKRILSREERQEFWTKVILDESNSMTDRLRASDLLAKSGGDFVSRVEVSGNLTVEDLVVGASKV